MIKRIANLITFYVERFILGGATNHFLFVAFLIVIISISAGSLMQLFYNDKSLLESIWWAFLHLSDPGYLGDDQGGIRRFVATIVTILGYVIFMGSLVAIMVQLLNSTIKKLESGFTPIVKKNHILILGWTNRTPIIVREILLSEERVNRFLKRINRRKLNIVILKEDVNSQLVNDLKKDLGPLWDNRAIIFRSGNPLKMDHLQNVDYLNASVIIIPSADFAYGGSERIDTRNVKLLYAIIKEKRKIANLNSRVLVEIFDYQKIEILSSKFSKELEIVPSNIIISRLFAQTIRHKGISLLYSEMLSNEGSEIYINNYPELIGKDFRTEIIPSFPQSIVIGILKKDNEKYIPMFNPSKKYTYQNEDQLILVSEDLKKSYCKISDSLIKPDVLLHAKEKYKNKLDRKVLIVGWSNKLITLLSELKSYDDEKYQVDIFSSIELPQRNKLLSVIDDFLAELDVNHIIGDSSKRFDYESLSLHKYDTIIILSNDNSKSSEEADALTVMRYIILERMLDEIDHDPHLIIEILDDDNIDLFDKNRCEILISPLLISYYLAQVSLQPSIGEIFKQLFSSGGSEIYIKDAASYNISEDRFSFEEIQNIIYSYGDIVLGILIYGDDGSMHLHLNPRKDSIWKIKYDDKFIIID